MHSVGFPPFARKDARVLILGSLPGKVSLEQGQYYAQARNAFWPIMGKLVDALPELPYTERIAKLTDAHIALWDVCAEGFRPGSLDSDIEAASIVPNDFAGFFRAHTQIKLICFNGQKANDVYRRKVLPTLPAALQMMPYEMLPSTSPAHAGMRFEEKLKRWRKVLAPFIRPT